MNIDKDIERCKELIKTEHSNWIGMSNQDAIENVLLRLEGLEKIFNLIDESAVRIDNTPITSTLEVDLNKLFTPLGFLDNETLVNIKLKNTTRYKVDLDSNKSELETWKKIAEKLAERFAKTSDYSYEGNNFYYCGAIEDTCKISEVSIPNEVCKQCIIDWARNEVQNGNNSSCSN